MLILLKHHCFRSVGEEKKAIGIAFSEAFVAVAGNLREIETFCPKFFFIYLKMSECLHDMHCFLLKLRKQIVALSS